MLSWMLCLLLWMAGLPVRAKVKVRSSVEWGIEANFKAGSAVFGKLRVTLAIQMDKSRLSKLDALVSVWDGPISCAIYVPPDIDTKKHLDSLTNYYQQHDLVSQYVSLHTVVDRRPKKSGKHLFPMNVLRNVAMSNVHTDFVLYIDADFLPSHGARKYLDAAVVRPSVNRLLRSRQVFVVPAFERYQTASSGQQGGLWTVARLFQELNSGQTVPFHMKGYFPGHAWTDFPSWVRVSQKEDPEPYKVSWHPGFEPYYLALAASLPPAYDGFIGFGYNKVCWVQEVACTHDFWVMPKVFVVHYNHDCEDAKVVSRTKQNCAQERWKKHRAEQERNSLVAATEFHQYLKRSYGKETVQKRCNWPRYKTKRGWINRNPMKELGITVKKFPKLSSTSMETHSAMLDTEQFGTREGGVRQLHEM
jgi:hypothetical protein